MDTSILLSSTLDTNYRLWIILGFVGFILIALGVVVLEAVILRLLQWATFRQSLIDSFKVTVVKAILGLCLVFLTLPSYDAFPIFITIMWALSILIEGFLLQHFRRQPARKTWTTALVSNTVSYLALYIWIITDPM